MLWEIMGCINIRVKKIGYSKFGVEHRHLACNVQRTKWVCKVENINVLLYSCFSAFSENCTSFKDKKNT